MEKIKLVYRMCPLCLSDNKTSIYAQENYNFDALDEYAFSARKIPENEHYHLIKCRCCDIIYANSALSLNDIAENYHQAAFDSSEEAHFAANTYAKYLSKIIKNLPDTNGTIDIGTGDGAFLEELLKKGFINVLGIEPSQAPIEASLPMIKPLIRKGLFNPNDFKDKSISLITCFQTFEHLYEPLKICQESYRILKKGGAFYTVCHNSRAISCYILGMKSPIFDIEHLQLFSPRSAKIMLIKAGFKKVYVKPIFNVYPLHYWLKLLPITKTFKIKLIRFLKKIKLGYLPIMLPAGNMAVIGYKEN